MSHDVEGGKGPFPELGLPVPGDLGAVPSKSEIREGETKQAGDSIKFAFSFRGTVVYSQEIL